MVVIVLRVVQLQVDVLDIKGDDDHDDFSQDGKYLHSIRSELENEANSA